MVFFSYNSTFRVGEAGVQRVPAVPTLGAIAWQASLPRPCEDRRVVGGVTDTVRLTKPQHLVSLGVTDIDGTIQGRHSDVVAIRHPCLTVQVETCGLRYDIAT